MQVAERMPRQTGIDLDALNQVQATLSTSSELDKFTDDTGGAVDQAPSVTTHRERSRRELR